MLQQKTLSFKFILYVQEVQNARAQILLLLFLPESKYPLTCTSAVPLCVVGIPVHSIFLHMVHNEIVLISSTGNWYLRANLLFTFICFFESFDECNQVLILHN